MPSQREMDALTHIRQGRAFAARKTHFGDYLATVFDNNSFGESVEIRFGRSSWARVSAAPVVNIKDGTDMTLRRIQLEETNAVGLWDQHVELVEARHGALKDPMNGEKLGGLYDFYPHRNLWLAGSGDIQDPDSLSRLIVLTNLVLRNAGVDVYQFHPGARAEA